MIEQKKRPPRKPLTLKQLRKGLGKTQVEVATASGMTQPEVSAIEAREDLKISTLRKYAAALGGKLETRIVFGDYEFVHLIDL